VIRIWLRRCERRRRLIAAALAAVAVISGYLALRPTVGPAVLVAARDLSPGLLRPGDLRAVALPHPPDGALRTGATGRVLATAMRRGEPLTDVRLLDSLRLPPGAVATPVRIAVLAAHEGRPASPVAEQVTVLTIPAAKDDHGALVVLATTPSQANELAGAQAGGHLSITIQQHLK
jgi:Flp pilus assembly protein CpaB